MLCAVVTLFLLIKIVVKMVEFLDTNGTSAEISKLISRSKEKLYIVSPYLQIPDNLKTMIKHVEKESHDLDIRFLYRYENEGKLNEKDSEFLFKELKTATVFSLENLHAKCYLNENTAIITSMNLFRYSQQNNWEVGIKADKSNPNDQVLYEDVYRHVDFLMKSSKQQGKKGINFDKLRSTIKQVGKVVIPNSGYCVRCGVSINIDRDKPFCTDHFKSWARYKNGNFPEKYCHYCGKKCSTTFNKPFCRDCYDEIHL